MTKQFYLSLLAVGLCAGSIAQQKTFTYKELQGNRLPTGFYSPLPQIQGWQGKNDEQLLLSKPGPDGGAVKNWVMDLKTGKMTEQVEAPASNTPAQPAPIVRLVKGDLVYLAGGKKTRLTQSPEVEEKNPTLSPDGQFVAFTRKNDLYTINLTSLAETRLTTDGSDLILNGYASWVYWEEIFGRGTAFRAFWWSPNSQTLAYMRFDQSGIQMFPLYNADGTHGHLEETRYPKAGDPNPAVQLGFVAPTGGRTTWVDFNPANDHQLGWPKWHPNRHLLYVQWQNRGQDSLIMYAVNPADGSKKPVYTETQKAWISLDEADDRLTFTNNGQDMIIMSDQSGWKQYALYSADGQFKNHITQGNFTVQQVVAFDEKNKTLYLQVRGLDNSARVDLVSVGTDGKNFKRLTFEGYNHGRFRLSPNFKYFVTTYSNINTPTAMAVIDTKGKKLYDLGSMASTTMQQYALPKQELIRIKSADGKYDLPALITWPINYEPGKKYPMLVSIYGGPDATQVMDQWGWNGQRQWLAQEGLLQVSFDNRASGHFGKAAIAEIHRQLGILEIEDFKHMAQHFIKQGVADPERICITGFSFGGYMSCMALTYGADVFTNGMAGGSVTDWPLYDSHYTERYMDTPQENPEGYKKTSAMTYADRYKGMLQLVHGTMDDTVHMQYTIQLVGALQDKGKTFELMLYPNGRHGWGNLPARNAHYNNLKNQFIYKYLLRKAMPE